MTKRYICMGKESANLQLNNNQNVIHATCILYVVTRYSPVFGLRVGLYK